ncbi:MAG: hypothetical protein HYZ81_21870 [Nitrospinae bacterium]|nr:hypothetical protein [Nitrospinota bacterium]
MGPGQALHALVFLDTRVLNYALEGRITAVCADKQITVPVVMIREAVAAVLSRMDGTAHVVAKLLYGSGVRSMEAVRLRVKDISGGHMCGKRSGGRIPGYSGRRARAAAKRCDGGPHPSKEG